MSLDKVAADLLSREWAIDSAFIEKDWYAVLVLQALSELSYQNITTLFTGGTSLSKAHGILKRFSEDLDFRAIFEGSKLPTRAEKRNFRSQVEDAINAIDGVVIRDKEINGLGFKFFITYPNQFDTPNCMRPELQVEFSYTQPSLEPDLQTITSFISEYKSEDAETKILCLSPVEIAADKFSSLTWRILKRDRSYEKDDPTMIRHLHDLCALREIIDKNQTLFSDTVLTSYEVDQKSLNRRLNMPIKEASKKALLELQGDSQCKNEYKQFVAEMSYDIDVIGFDKALLSYADLVTLL